MRCTTVNLQGRSTVGVPVKFWSRRCHSINFVSFLPWCLEGHQQVSGVCALNSSIQTVPLSRCLGNYCRAVDSIINNHQIAWLVQFTKALPGNFMTVKHFVGFLMYLERPLSATIPLFQGKQWKWRVLRKKHGIIWLRRSLPPRASCSGNSGSRPRSQAQCPHLQGELVSFCHLCIPLQLKFLFANCQAPWAILNSFHFACLWLDNVEYLEMVTLPEQCPRSCPRTVLTYRKKWKASSEFVKDSRQC